MNDLLPPVSPALNQQIAEVKRELKARAYVYPRLVGAGKMSQTKADYQVSVMNAVLRTLEGALAGTSVKNL